MVRVGEIWYQLNDVKISRSEFKNVCLSNTIYMLFGKRKHMMETF